jgi:imidazolonepropionase-like amidohydrolase
MVEQCGMSPAASIRAATVDAARLLRHEGRLGTLTPGAYADVIALNANPLDDITELTRVAMVIANGRLLRNDL